MKLVVLGLSLSSSWGNGHATTYRALLRAFAARGHAVLFLERDVPWYAEHRDLPDPGFCQFALYGDLAELEREWRARVEGADAVIVGSFTPEGIEVGRWAQETARGIVAFYDIDTPVTLGKLAVGEADYISEEVIPGYDLYLSFTGGPTLASLETVHGSPRARPMYCSVDAQAYRPLETPTRWDLSYLGTYSQDRQPTLERLLVEVAREAPDLRFCVAGPLYPADLDWPPNVDRLEHVAPAEHPAFYAASRFTLNVTRADMKAAGHSPSVRLFEAGACGAPIISDSWEGLDGFFKPGGEIIIADEAATVLAALRHMPEAERIALGRAGRKRVLSGHTAAHRAAELEAALEESPARTPDIRRWSRVRWADRRMTAAVVTGPGRMEIQRIAKPRPGPGQVRVRVEGCGVCASNLTTWEGPPWMRFPTAPGELGHEGWGVVDALGPDVQGLAAGDRVALLSHRSYAQFDIAGVDALVRLPPALDGKPFPGEALGCAMNIFRRADIAAGQTVAIIGIGFLGALLTRLAAEAGARVIAISRRSSSLALARRMGAAEILPMDDHRTIVETVGALTGGRFCERVIEAVGKQWPLDLAAELTAEHARLVIAGYHQDGPRQVNMQLWNWRGLDVINAHERSPLAYARGVREAVEAVVSGRIDPAPLYTHVYPLDRLGEALDATRDRPEGFVKALVLAP